MTREEAIKILRKEIECLSHTTCSDCPLEKVCDPIMTTPFDSEYIEVYEMAIKALEQESCDCISRQALLEEIENGIKAGNYEEGYEEYPHINDMDDIIECIKYADSIQPTTKENLVVGDCISRAEVINAISHAELSFQVESDLNFENYKREVQEIADGILKGQVKAISDLASVQPKPKTGHWIEDDMTYCGVELVNYKCDKCGEMGGAWRKGLKPDKLPKYCMNCGAKMLPTDSEKE